MAHADGDPGHFALHDSVDAAVAALQALTAALPRGRMGYQYNVADSTAISNGELATVQATATFTADATRRLWIPYGATYFASIAQKSFQIKIRWAAGAAVTTSGTQAGTTIAVESAVISQVAHLSGLIEIAPGVLPNGQVTVGLFLATVTGPGGTATGRNPWLGINDVGV